MGNVMPRFGLAYALDSKTTLRAGYGIFFDTIGVAKSYPIQTGFARSTPIQASLDNGMTYLVKTANPFPSGLLAPMGPSGGLTTSLGQEVDFYNPNLKHGYAQRWSFGLQRLLPAQILLDASYVGNRGTRLGVQREWNALPNQYLSTSPVRDQKTIDFLSAQFPNPFYKLDPIFGTTVSRRGLLVPFPQFGSMPVTEPIGYAWYHSLQVKAEKRMSRGFTFQWVYTFSKTMEAMEFLNAADPMPYRSLSAMDRPHRLTMNSIWEIPVGRGRAFGARLPAPANFVLGGWQFSGVVVRQAGAPLGFGNAIFNGNLSEIALPKSERSVDHWFNVDAGFNRNSSQQLSSNVRTFPLRFSGVRSDGQASWDFALVKNFAIRDRVSFQFRGEMYNAWNHPNLDAPNTSPTSSSFGRITSMKSDGRNGQLALRVKF
jgi:hypothetical protein